MKIDSGRFTMESRREFKSSLTQELKMERGEIKTEGQDAAVAMQGGFGGGFLEQLAYATYSADGQQKDGINELRAPDPGRSAAHTKQLGQSLPTIAEMREQTKFSTLSYLFRIFFGNNSKFRNSIWGSSFNMGMRYQSYSFTQTYEEHETMSFETTGTVKTADGREINFDINVEMSRSFYEQTNAYMIKAAHPMLDPLVINLNGNADSISDQKFFFDLDCDGKEEEISNLAEGSGFLAFDENEDGVINDGSELFGATSGDGFSELAEYDLDGNGWIDEADEIFDKLVVWSVGEDGKAVMHKLKESDVGAICLTSIPTRFNVKDENNETKALVRESGFFLRESDGRAGIVQQIDLARMSS